MWHPESERVGSVKNKLNKGLETLGRNWEGRRGHELMTESSPDWLIDYGLPKVN